MTSEGRNGAEDPWEKVNDCVSGPTLDRTLDGRMENRFIHEPLEDSESLEDSAIGWVE